MSKDKLFKFPAKELTWGISQGGHVAHLTDNANPDTFIEVNGNEGIGSGHEVSMASLYNTVSDTATMLFFRSLAEKMEQDYENALADKDFKHVLVKMKDYITAEGREEQQDALYSLTSEMSSYEKELEKKRKDEKNKKKEEDEKRLVLLNYYIKEVEKHTNGSLSVPKVMEKVGRANYMAGVGRENAGGRAKKKTPVITYNNLDAYKFASDNDWAIMDEDGEEVDLSDRFFRYDDPKNTFLGKAALWVSTNAALFPHEPSPTDVKQGYGVEDCFMLSALISLADKHPEKIREALKDNGDGTVTVRFFKKGEEDTEKKAVYVTVNKTVNKSLGGANTYASSSLWVQMIEKAYVAYKALSDPDVENSYRSIDRSSTHIFMNAFDGDNEYGIPTVGFRPYGVDCDLDDKGKIAGEYDTFNGESILRQGRSDYLEQEHRLFDFLKSRVDEKGEVLTVGANFAGVDGASDRRSMLHKYGIRDGHAYAVLGTFEQEDENGNVRKFIRLRDPYAMFSCHYDSEYRLRNDGSMSMISGSMNAGNDNMGTFFLELKDFNHFFNSFSGMTKEAVEDFIERYVDFALKGDKKQAENENTGIGERDKAQQDITRSEVESEADMNEAGQEDRLSVLEGILDNLEADREKKREPEGMSEKTSEFDGKIMSGSVSKENGSEGRNKINVNPKKKNAKIPDGWVDLDDTDEKAPKKKVSKEKPTEFRVVKAAIETSSKQAAAMFEQARELIRNKEDAKIGRISEGKYYFSEKIINLSADLNSARYTALGGLYSSFRDSAEMKNVKAALNRVRLNMKSGMNPGDAKAALEKLEEAASAYINNPKKAHNNRWRAVDVIDRFAKAELRTLEAVRSNNPLNMCVDAIWGKLDNLYEGLDETAKGRYDVADCVMIDGRSLRSLLYDEIIKRNPGVISRLSDRGRKITDESERDIMGQIILKTLLEGREVGCYLTKYTLEMDGTDIDIKKSAKQGVSLDKPNVIINLSKAELEKVGKELNENIRTAAEEKITGREKILRVTRSLSIIKLKRLIGFQDDCGLMMSTGDVEEKPDAERAQRIKDELDRVFSGIDVNKLDSLYDEHYAHVPALCEILEKIGDDKDKRIAGSIRSMYAGKKELCDMGLGIIPTDIEATVLKVLNAEGSRQLYAEKLGRPGAKITSVLNEEEMERCVYFCDDMRGKMADKTTETKLISRLTDEIKSGKAELLYDAVVTGNLRKTRSIYAQNGKPALTEKNPEKLKPANKVAETGKNSSRRNEAIRIDDKKLNK